MPEQDRLIVALAPGLQSGDDLADLGVVAALVQFLRQLARRVGNVSPAAQARVTSLSLARLEELGEALLDFTVLADLEIWLGR